jgi:kynurenine formamidase
MILSIQFNNETHQFDAAKPIHISIPMNFNGAQPNAYGVERAESKPCEAGGIIGDTRRGGSVNFEQVKFIPHCNGTHTECVGHITHERISVHDCLQDAFILAELITVAPENALETDEAYSVKLDKNDFLITEKILKSKLRNPNSAIIIRTLPNDERKKSLDYSRQKPPFFSLEAMQFIVESGVKHLLVDVPSLERLDDEGKLANHRIFWQVEPDSFEINPNTRLNSTVTEMIYVPNEIKDGLYPLNLQIAPFTADATPSRPLIFRILSD